MQIDFNTTEGARIKVQLEDRLAQLRNQNDDVTLDPIASAVLRGRISEIKSMLAAPAPYVAAMPSYGKAFVR